MNFTATSMARAGWPAPAMDPRLLIAIGLIFAELMLVTALALFFSTYSSPLLATLLTLGLWVAGHFNADLAEFRDRGRLGGRGGIGARALLRAAEPGAVRREGRSGATACRLPLRHVAYTLAYAGVYITILLTAAVAIFRRRDFK